MTTNFALPQLLTLVKAWQARIDAVIAHPMPAYDATVLQEVSSDMTVFVATINGVVAHDNVALDKLRTNAIYGRVDAVSAYPKVAEVNDYVMVKVQNCRRYHTSHPPHVYNDHGKDFACWGEAA